jgi:YbbR domain-containing protein
MEKLVRQINEYLTSIPRPKNWVLKLLSFFFALFLWYFVVGEDKVDMNVTIPVEIVNLPRDLVISNQFKKQLEVTVSGQRSLIQGMAAQHISRSIDLSKASPGTVVIQNQDDSIPLPRGINILRIQPTSLTLLLDQLIHKELRIEPVLTGKIHGNYQLDSVTLEPSSLEISGPKEIIGQEEFVNTSPIDISGLRQATVKQSALEIKPFIADIIGEPVVSVQLNIIEKKTTRKVAGIPVEFTPVNSKAREIIYRLKPPTVSVEAELPLSLVKETRDLRSLFTATVKPEPLKAGSFQLKVSVDGPANVKIISFSPATLTLEIGETKKLKIRKK